MNFLKKIKDFFVCPFPRSWVRVSLKVKNLKTCPYCGYFGILRPTYVVEHYFTILVNDTLEANDPFCRSCHTKFDDYPKKVEYLLEADEYLPRWKDRRILKNFRATKTVNNV